MLATSARRRRPFAFAASRSDRAVARPIAHAGRDSPHEYNQ
jgi:hypothetical protein